MKRKTLVGILCTSVCLCMLCACGNNKEEIKIESWTEDIGANAIVASENPSNTSNTSQVKDGDVWFVNPEEYKNKTSSATTGESETLQKGEDEKEVSTAILESSLTIEQVNTNDSENTANTTTP